MSFMASQFLIDSAGRYPDKVAVEHNDEKISYRELLERSCKLAVFLAGKRVKANDRVVTLMPKSINSVIVYLGANMAGATIAHLDVDYPRERIINVLSKVKPAFLITYGESYDMLSKDLHDFGINVILTREEKSFTGWPKIFQWDEIQAIEPVSEMDRLPLIKDEEAVAYFVYTSGSTGEAKGVLISNRSLVEYTKQIVKIFHLDENSRVLNVAPVYYDAFIGDVTSAFCMGATVVLLGKILFPSEITRVLSEKKITNMGATGYLISLLAGKFSDINRYELDHLKYVTSGGDSCLPKYLRRIKDHIPHVRFINGYGQTETTILNCSYEFSEIPNDRENAFPIGKPFPNIRFYVFDAGKLLKPEPGQVGELYVSGNQVMAGYWQDEETNRQVIRTDLVEGERVFKTGDLVTVDADGNYVFVGRNDDMIKRGGNRVSLLEVEQAILGLPEVLEVAVIGINPQGGPENKAQYDLQEKKIIAFVQTKEQLEDETIMTRLREKLPMFMLPDEIIFLESLHLYNKVKIDKVKLKELYLSKKMG